VRAVDVKRLAGVNARLARARVEYRDALTAEHKATELSVRFPPGMEDARKPIQRARERTRIAAEHYQEALDEFIKLGTRPSG
jgi:hypothetical protein